MSILSLVLAIACLASFMIRDGIAFIVAPKVAIVANERILHRQFKCSMILTAADKRNQAMNTIPTSDPEDTVRVRIWRVLAASPGKELTLKELGTKVGERRTGELRNHLQHVKKQSGTLQNKKNEWKERRGLPTSDTKRTDKLRVRIRRGQKNEVYIKLA